MKYVSPVWEIYDEWGEHLMTVDLPFAIAVTDMAWPTLLGYRIMEDETRRVTGCTLPARTNTSRSAIPSGAGVPTNHV